jgi:dolichyl-phosphate-mannose-protein mannosyltransferase
VNERKAFWILAAIVAGGAAFRFYNLAWGAPYYHFHMDEHFVIGPADTLRHDVRAAAMGSKFFMYSPMMMYLINIVRGAYEALIQPLDLNVPSHQVTYMVLSRAIAATFGTATILLCYAIAARVAGRVAGLLAAFFLACAVLHLRDSHFATTDMPMVFFCMLTLWWAIHVAERATWPVLVAAGASVGAAVASKYTGLLSLGAVGIAYLLAPDRPREIQPVRAWVIWVLRGLIPIASAMVTFFLLDPLVLWYPDKFLLDFRQQVIDPLTGVTQPIFFAQFADLTNHRLYWFTNLLWWSLGPALEILGLMGVVWLLARRDRRAAVAASFPIIYYLVAGESVAPMIRYTLPLLPALAIAAGVLGADWLARPRWRLASACVVGITVVATGLYALAYMNVFRQPDARLEASKWLVENVPEGARVLVEPSQNMPPMGSYYTDTKFRRDYVLWGSGRSRREAERERKDYYHLFMFDAYRYLYADRYDDAEKRRYIESRLALVDWIVIDDTYVQWYDHLKGPENAVVRQHYKDLLDGKLGFGLVQSFKVYPKIFGVTIPDEGAEFTFRFFDHPRVYIFRRTAAQSSSNN